MKGVIWGGFLLLVLSTAQAQQQQIKLNIVSSERRTSTAGYAVAIVGQALWGGMNVVLICDANDHKHCGPLPAGDAVFRVTEGKDKPTTLTTTQNGKTFRFTRNSLHIEHR